MVAGLAVAGQSGNVVTLIRASLRATPAARARQDAIDRLRARVRRDTIMYAVRRAHDPEFGWLVCDVYLIDGADIDCVTDDLAHALECFDPAREVGVKLRGRAGAGPLVNAIDLRLSALLFGTPNALRHCMLG